MKTITILSCAASEFAATPRLPLVHSSVANVSIPRVLLGTGGGGGGYNTDAWLANGGQGFDTAATYCYNSNAPYCSHVAIASSIASVGGAARDNYFLISKFEPEDFSADVAWLNSFGRSVSRGILQDMSTDYVDMLMFHQAGRSADASNPRPDCFNASAANTTGTYAQCRIATFAAMLNIMNAGAARSIAVSNWQIRDLQQVYDALGVWPAALEIEVHPYWHEDALIAFAMSNNITIINYAPLAVSPAHGLLTDPVVVAIASAHGVTPAQAALRWGLQKTGGVVIPRSANATHMVDNMNIFNFTLTDTDMQALSVLPQKKIFNVYCQPWC